MSQIVHAREIPDMMQFVIGDILDIGCGNNKIAGGATGVDVYPAPGVDFIEDLSQDPKDVIDKILGARAGVKFDTVFSAYLLDRLVDRYRSIRAWRLALKEGGHIVLFLPDGLHDFDDYTVVSDFRYSQFLFWFQRAFCGQAKDHNGVNFKPLFELVSHGRKTDTDKHLSSFYIVAKKV